MLHAKFKLQHTLKEYASPAAFHFSLRLFYVENLQNCSHSGPTLKRMFDKLTKCSQNSYDLLALGACAVNDTLLVAHQILVQYL